MINSHEQARLELKLIQDKSLKTLEKLDSSVSGLEATKGQKSLIKETFLRVKAFDWTPGVFYLDEGDEPVAEAPCGAVPAPGRTITSVAACLRRHGNESA